MSRIDGPSRCCDWGCAGREELSHSWSMGRQTCNEYGHHKAAASVSFDMHSMGDWDWGLMKCHVLMCYIGNMSACV